LYRPGQHAAGNNYRSNETIKMHQASIVRYRHMLWLQDFKVLDIGGAAHVQPDCVPLRLCQCIRFCGRHDGDDLRALKRRSSGSQDSGSQERCRSPPKPATTNPQNWRLGSKPGSTEQSLNARPPSERSRQRPAALGGFPTMTGTTAGHGRHSEYTPPKSPSTTLPDIVCRKHTSCPG
jgi:hypothetical protein